MSPRGPREAGAAPTVAEIDAIAGRTEPLIRNLPITHAYHQLSRSLASERWRAGLRRSLSRAAMTFTVERPAGRRSLVAEFGLPAGKYGSCALARNLILGAIPHAVHFEKRTELTWETRQK